MGITKKLASGLAACALALTVGATAASAGVLTYTVTTGMQAGAWSTTVAIPQFNTSLGTLESIDFALAGELLGTVRLTNTTGGFAAGSIGGGIGSAGLGLSTSPGAAVNLPPGTLSPPQSASGSASTTVTGSGLAPFIGSGNANIDIQSTGPQCTASGGATVVECNGTTQGTITATLNFVPEPASLAILGLGLAALGAGAIRRRT